MKVRIFADVSSDHFGRPHEAFVGEGETFEAAREDAIGQVANMLRQLPAEVEVASGMFFPPAIAALIPSPPGPDYGIAIYFSVCHSSGDEYGWRFTARRGSQEMTNHAVMDRNSDYSIELPEGSFEWIEGEWVPCAALHYEY